MGGEKQILVMMVAEALNPLISAVPVIGESKKKINS